MPRNAEVVRQWNILRDIERVRGTGVTIDELAEGAGVTTRTIRRDLQALEEAGFPLFDDKTSDDGRTRWRMNGHAFHGMTAGLTVAELCALYFSRSLLESLSSTPFHDDLSSAFDKLTGGLTPHMRRFLDALPRVLAAKPEPGQRDGDGLRQSQVVSRALDATLNLRQATLRYHSASSDRTKTYLVHPYRLAYAQGGLYLLAFVPEYGEVRTFAVERILEIALLDDRFTPLQELPDAAFPHSLGVHSGVPETVEIEFQPPVADYVSARRWHPSQKLSTTPAGGVRVTLDVCDDHALRSWILSFGPFARVVAPEHLSREIARQIEEARAQYAF